MYDPPNSVLKLGLARCSNIEEYQQGAKTVDQEKLPHLTRLWLQEMEPGESVVKGIPVGGGGDVTPEDLRLGLLLDVKLPEGLLCLFVDYTLELAGRRLERVNHRFFSTLQDVRDVIGDPGRLQQSKLLWLKEESDPLLIALGFCYLIEVEDTVHPPHQEGQRTVTVFQVVAPWMGKQPWKLELWMALYTLEQENHSVHVVDATVESEPHGGVAMARLFHDRLVFAGGLSTDADPGNFRAYIWATVASRIMAQGEKVPYVSFRQVYAIPPQEIVNHVFGVGAPVLESAR